MSEPAPTVHKVYMCGAMNSGKSALMARFAKNEFTDAYAPTIGVDFTTRVLTVTAGCRRAAAAVKMQVWDCSGDPRFVSVTRQFSRGAHSIVIVFNVCDSGTFEAATTTLFAATADARERPGVSFVLVGTHADAPESQRQVSADDARRRAQELGAADYFEVSSKREACDGGVDTVFQFLADTVALNMRESEGAR